MEREVSEMSISRRPSSDILCRSGGPALCLSLWSALYLLLIKRFFQVDKTFPLSFISWANVVCRKDASWSRLIISKRHDEDGLLWNMLMTYVPKTAISHKEPEIIFFSWFLSASYGCHHLHPITYHAGVEKKRSKYRFGWICVCRCDMKWSSSVK